MDINPKTKKEAINEGVDMLCGAVVELACKDYARAYVDGLNLDRLNRFFFSRDFALYCDLDPEWLLSEIRRRCDAGEKLFERCYSQF